MKRAHPISGGTVDGNEEIAATALTVLVDSVDDKVSQ